MARLLTFALFLLSVLLSGSAGATSPTELATTHYVLPDHVYTVNGGAESRLDLYLPRRRYVRERTDALPTVVYFHGGGWVSGSKTAGSLQVLPYLERGWAAINVGYRLADQALAPAAVEDARCVLSWIAANAAEYRLDTDRVILTGRSAGGHLALITGMLTAAAGLDARCAARAGGQGLERASLQAHQLRPAAIINWSGITDVVDLIAGPNATQYAVRWLGNQPNRSAVARLVSPLTHVKPGLPPILTLHGDQDRVVPFEHATRLHDALDRAGIRHRLHVLEGREHFNDYTLADMNKAWAAIDGFLAEVLP